MSYEEILILKQQLQKALERITYLEESIVAKDNTIKILQQKIDYLKSSHRIREYESPQYYSGKSYDSIEKLEDSQDRIRQFLQVQLTESGNFDNTLDQNKLGERPMLRIPQLQRIPFFQQGSSLLGSSPSKITKQLYNSEMIKGYSSVRNQKLLSLFKSFLIIASDQNKPLVLFNYPNSLDHQQAILQLIYPSIVLKPIGKSKGYNDLMRTASNTIKDKFIIPLKKPQSLQKFNKQNEYHFLIGFQVQDIFYSHQIVSSHPVFYCFLSDHKCVGLFYQLLNLIINTINGYKNQIALTRGIGNSEELFENGLLKTALNECQLSTLLSRIHRNKFEYNQHLRIKLNKDQTFIEQIPPKQNQSDLIFTHPTPITLSSYKITCRFFNGNNFQCNLILLLFVYFVCEKRIVLYSSSKQKISMCIMLMLQLVKPLEYVNPIIQGQFKQHYLEYLEAPMAVLIGLWGQKKSSKGVGLSLKKSNSYQSNFKDDFDKQKIQIKDGLIFNIDLQKAYGQSDSQLNNIVTNLSKQLKKPSGVNYYKRIQSLLQMVMNFDLKSDWATMLRVRIQSTQMFCYHKQRQ